MNALKTRAAHLAAIDEGTDMNFLQRLLHSGSKDRFGINSALDGLRALQQRIETEKTRLQELNDTLRDQALNDPAAEIDENQILRQETRIKILEAALEKATAEAAGRLDRRKPEIEVEISQLEAKQKKIRRERDQELLRAIASFIKATGAQVPELPKRGQGGTITAPGMQEMAGDEITAFFAKLDTQHEPTGASADLAAVAAQIQKFKVLSYWGGQKGLEALAGTASNV